MKSVSCRTLPGGWSVVTAKNLAEVESLRPVWEKLQDSDQAAAPNADINRFITVIETMKDTAQPHVILLQHNGTGETLVIGRLEKRRIECRIGYKVLRLPQLRCFTIMYGGILGELGGDTCNVLMHELLDTLRRTEADVAFFNQLRVNSPVYKAIRSTPPFLCRSHFPKSRLHWQTILPKSREEFTKLVSKKEQRDIARCTRNLEKAGSGPIKVVCYRLKEDLEYFVNVASQIYASTYQRGLRVGFVNDTLTRSLLEQAEKEKWLRAYILYAGSEPVAFEVGRVYGKVYFADYAGFDLRWKTHRPGILLQLNIFEELNREGGVDIYDYGLGDAKYKQKFGNVSWTEASAYIFAPRLYPILVNMAQSSMMGLSLGLEYVLNRVGLVGWIKKHWRKTLQPVKYRI